MCGTFSLFLLVLLSILSEAREALKILYRDLLNKYLTSCVHQAVTSSSSHTSEAKD